MCDLETDDAEQRVSIFEAGNTWCLARAFLMLRFPLTFQQTLGDNLSKARMKEP